MPKQSSFAKKVAMKSVAMKKVKAKRGTSAGSCSSKPSKPMKSMKKPSPKSMAQFKKQFRKAGNKMLHPKKVKSAKSWLDPQAKAAALKRPSSSKRSWNAPPSMTLPQLMRSEINVVPGNRFAHEDMSEEDINILKLWSILAVRREICELYLEGPWAAFGLAGFHDFKVRLLRNRLREGEYTDLLARYNAVSMGRPDPARS